MTQTQWLIVIIIGVLLSLVVRAVFELLRSRREKPAYLAVAGSMGLN
jgi:ABC-type bacteriocin/lantibiotic exporter with double-glycine peptidase domain